MERIATALRVTVPYMFSNERFSLNPVIQSQEQPMPFLERFKYHLDHEKRVLAFSVSGLFLGTHEVDRLASSILGVCSAYGKGGLDILVDHRQMSSADG